MAKLMIPFNVIGIDEALTAQIYIFYVESLP